MAAAEELRLALGPSTSVEAPGEAEEGQLQGVQEAEASDVRFWSERRGAQQQGTQRGEECRRKGREEREEEEEGEELLDEEEAATGLKER